MTVAMLMRGVMPKKHAPHRVFRPRWTHTQSMPAYSFARRLRRTVWAMLLFWLFATVAGVVNACMLTPTGPAERSVVRAGITTLDLQADAGTGAHTDADPGGHHEQVASVPSHGHDGSSGKVSCLKFCDDESSALTKGKLPADLGVSLLTVLVPWNSAAAIGSVASQKSLERPDSQGPPLVIRFPRLTL